jgi:predicted dehydrogenase
VCTGEIMCCYAARHASCGPTDAGTASRSIGIILNGATPRSVWNPDVEQPSDFFADRTEVPDASVYDDAFKIQWELFLRHVALDEPLPWTLREGAKGVQLAEAGLRSRRERRWVDPEPL